MNLMLYRVNLYLCIGYWLLVKELMSLVLFVVIEVSESE